MIAIVFALTLFAVWQEDRLICIFSPKTPEERWAEQTILNYIELKELNIVYCTTRYNALLKGILLGDIPELTQPPSVFIKNDAEGQHIIKYAAQNFRLSKEMRSSVGTEIPALEAVPILDFP